MRLLLLLTFATFYLQAAAQLQTSILPRDTSYTVYQSLLKVRKAYPDVRVAEAKLVEGVAAFRQLTYASFTSSRGVRELHLDIFRPEGGAKLPAIIMVHGGGWRSGDKSMQVPFAIAMAQKGYVAIPIEYQLSLEAAYPAAVCNIKAAARWVRDNAERFGIDTSRIGISGCSAGGQLAALVGLTSDTKQFGDVRCVNSGSFKAIVIVDGVVDFLAPASLNLERKANAADVAWLGGTFLDRPAVWKEASPIYWLRKNSPPILFINSGIKRFHAGQDEMVGMLKEYGIYHEVHSMNVSIHPFWLFHPWFMPTVSYMGSFFDKTLKHP